MPLDDDIAHRVALGPGDVAVVALPPFEVHDRVTFRRLTVLTESGAADLLGARFTGGPPGARCTDEWPAADATADPAEGAVRDDGDTPMLLLYLRPRGGPAVVDELRVAYEVDGRPAELTWRGFRIELDRPRGTTRCAATP